MYSSGYKSDYYRSTPCENCTTGVLLVVHLHSRCIIRVVHLGRGIHLGSLWVFYSIQNKPIDSMVSFRVHTGDKPKDFSSLHPLPNVTHYRPLSHEG